MATLHCKIGLIISTVCLCFSLSSQHRFDYGLGLSHTNVKDNASSLGLDINIEYKLKSFDLGLLINKSINNKGANSSILTNRSGTGPENPRRAILYEGTLWNYSRAELYLNYRHNRLSNNPFIGFGFGFHRVIVNQRTFLIGLAGKESKTAFLPKYIPSAFIRVGIPFKHFEFSSFVHVTKHRPTYIGQRDNFALFGTSLKIYLRQDDEIDIIHPKIRLFSLHFGASFYSPLNKNLADSYRPFLSIQYPFNEMYEIAFSFEFSGEQLGEDIDGTINGLDPDFDPMQTRDNTSSQISALKMKILKSIPSQGYTNFSYGIGLGIYNLQQFRRSTVLLADSNLGPFFTAGLKTKRFIASFDVNLPIGEIPVYVGLQTGLNININKKGWRKGSYPEHDVNRI